ncbi:MAG: class I SAM-dependent methyltransferase [Phycisphaerales bacterium]|nr:class I SAM-dependent methyltransferase [Phycisphaerales bacterium]
MIRRRAESNGTCKRTARKIAASVGLPPALVPFIVRVFAGMESLGSSPRVIASLLDKHATQRALAHSSRPGPPPAPRRSRQRPLRVLDLACGKGDLAISLARRFAWRVLAIDACTLFIDHANKRAARLGVHSLCEFRAADITRAMRPRRGILARVPAFDIAMMIGLWGVEQAAPLLSRLVRPGGLYIIDDAFAINDRVARNLNAATLTDAQQLVRANGDDVLHAALLPLRSVRSANARILARLSRNARTLARERPPLRPTLAEFLKRQRTASRMLERDLRPGLILARRA